MLEVLIGHPGGPFWANKHEGSWSIPKGIVEAGEDPTKAALREFAEETGTELEGILLMPLGKIVLKSGKEVVAWGAEGDLDPDHTFCNTVTMEWPRGSGRIIEFPEIDELRWCSPDKASELLNQAQKPLLDRLEKLLNHAE